MTVMWNTETLNSFISSIGTAAKNKNRTDTEGYMWTDGLWLLYSHVNYREMCYLVKRSVYHTNYKMINYIKLKLRIWI